MHRRFVIAILLVSATASTAASSTAPSKLNSIARYTLEKLRSRTSLAALEQTPASVTAEGELDVFITGDVSRAELEAAGAKVRTALPGIFTASLPLDVVERVAALRHVRTIEGASRAEPELNISVPSTNAHLNRGAGPNFTGINGEGVIVGDVDTGIDFGHGDFDDPSGNTRILRIWDQTTGAFWTSAQIDANTATQVDADGHGTHVMAIATGDGSQTGMGVAAHTYAGMAPRADIIMVKTTFSTTDIVDGIDYIFDQAALFGKPAVANLSLGSSFGSHDGTSPFEAGLSALTGPGRILCKSAGNAGGAAIHAERIVGAGETVATVSVSGSAIGRIFAIDGYYEAGENLTVKLTTPSGTMIGPLALGAGTVQGTPNGTVTLENGVFTTATGDAQITIIAESTIGSMNGTWTITFAPVVLGATNGEVDMWLYFATSGLGAGFVMGNQPFDEVISEPGNADSAITVGSYTTKQVWQDCNGFGLSFSGSVSPGSLSPFTSAGPTRDGREKPDIAAPGSAIGSTRSFDVSMSCNPAGSLLLRDGSNHIMNQGTSMASPHAAGAAALLLQKHPNWTPSHVKAYLSANAKTDGATGGVWNSLWGNGKLRLGDLIDPTTLVTAPNGGEYLEVGSATDLTWNASDNLSVTGVDLQLSRDGGSTYEDIALGIANTGTYAWNATGPVTPNALLKVTAHDAAGNVAIDESDATFEISTGLSAPIGGAITEFALSLLSSNPTSGPLNIELAVPVRSDLSLVLHDLQGRIVTTLAEGSYAPGRHEFRWDARNRQAEPGIYFIRLKAPGRELVKRLIVIQ